MSLSPTLAARACAAAILFLPLIAAAEPDAGEPPADTDTDTDAGVDIDLAEIEAALKNDAAANSGALSAPQPQPTAAASAFSLQSMNPDLSFVLDVAGAAFSKDEPLQTGGHDPRVTGFNFQQLELAVGRSVDPYFRFDANIVFGLDGLEIEEAYTTTLDLPARLQVRAGEFFTRFGRLNSRHPHAWDFVDQPIVLGR